MKKIKLLLGCSLAGVAVAITYFLFEGAVHSSTNYIWNTVFDSTDERWIVLPLALILGFLFFAMQHILDPKSENKEAHSLGGAPINPTFRNLFTVLFIGFMSLVAGASLGPEAVLVPASTIVGGIVASKLFKADSMATKALTAAAITALFAAFFHSYIVGILSVLLVASQAKRKVDIQLLLIAVLASVSSYLTLLVIDPQNSIFQLPDLNWKVALTDLLIGAVLVVVGYFSTFFLKYCHSGFIYIRRKTKLYNWWHLAIVAGLGVGILYYIGGPLVQFTGNQSIEPLIKDSAGLGVSGVIVVYIVKLLVVAWSKAMGYRGGLIFPMVFVASTLVVIAQFYVKDLSFGIALIAALIGIIAAEKKAKILV